MLTCIYILRNKSYENQKRLFLVFLLLSGSAYAQMSQKGTYRFLIQISPTTGSTTDSYRCPCHRYGCQREFPVQLQQTETGNGYRSPNVYKKGYELVNKDMINAGFYPQIDMINGWILSEKRPLSIVMAPEGTKKKARTSIIPSPLPTFRRNKKKPLKKSTSYI